MYIRRNYSFWMTLNWSKWPFIYGALYAACLTVLYLLVGWNLTLPWQPLSVIGIAVAFYLGFKNNSSYDRTWEARKIWGGIVNSSRTFGSAVVSFIQLTDAGEEAELHRALIHRHIAWLTALRYQLRLSREWEHTEDRVKALYIPNVCEEYYERLDQEIEQLLPPEECQSLKSRANMAAQLLAIQSREIHRLYVCGYIDGFHLHRFHQIIQELYGEQGRAERIKNFPFPRQYASTALWTTVVFSALVPFGLLGIFGDANGYTVWMAIPFSGLIIWIFFLMEKIGDYSENPFEGSYNDVPITAIARGIEIDLREMIDEQDIPKPIAPVNGFLM